MAPAAAKELNAAVTDARQVARVKVAKNTATEMFVRVLVPAKQMMNPVGQAKVRACELKTMWAIPFGAKAMLLTSAVLLT